MGRLGPTLVDSRILCRMRAVRAADEATSSRTIQQRDFSTPLRYGRNDDGAEQLFS